MRGRIVRPLLETSREEIETYLEIHRLSHVEDETNRDTALRRNLLRREVMPRLAELHDGAAANICRTAELLRQEDSFLDALAAAYLPQEGLSAGRQRLRSAPEVLRLRALRLLAERLPVGKKDFTAAHYRALSGLLEGGGMLTLPAGACAVCRDGKLTLLPSEPPLGPMVLHPGENVWGEYTISVRKTAGNFSQKSDTIVLNCDKIDGALSVGPYTGGQRADPSRQPGRAQRQAPAGGPGNPSGAAAARPGAVRRGPARRRVGRGHGHGISAGGVRPKYGDHRNNKWRKPQWLRATWIRIS